MFQIKTLNLLNNPSDNEVALCDRLLQDDLFPQSLYVMSLRACALYHLHGTRITFFVNPNSVDRRVTPDFGSAELQFKKILAVDPFRVDDMDVYSNILYVTENRLELSKLAHDFLALDKDKPEICCLVGRPKSLCYLEAHLTSPGNHYSLRAEHEKAIKYFRRATQLDRTYLSAWTLMGHEYIEMKNSHAAIEAYRKAVGERFTYSCDASRAWLTRLMDPQTSTGKIIGRGTVSDRHTNYSACINTPCTIISTLQLFGASLPSMKLLLPCLIVLSTRHRTCRRRLSVFLSSSPTSASLHPR